MISPATEPLHIRPAWQRVAARLQSVARTNESRKVSNAN